MQFGCVGRRNCGRKTMTHSLSAHRGRTFATAAATLASLLLSGPGLAAEPAADVMESSELTVRITVPDRKSATGDGEVRLGLFDGRAAYDSGREALGRTVRLRDGRADVPLTGLVPGRYAFRIYYDANRNGRLDTGAFGLPAEAVYYSNDASDLFSAPEWEEASFRLSEGAYAYNVELE